MKKRFMKKAGAFIMTLVMLLTILPMDNVYAAEHDAHDAQNGLSVIAGDVIIDTWGVPVSEVWYVDSDENELYYSTEDTYPLTVKELNGITNWWFTAAFYNGEFMMKFKEEASTVPDVTASLGDVEIKGEVGKPLSSYTATVTLQNGTFTNSTPLSGAAEWFSGLPTGISVKFTRNGSNYSVGTFEFSGTPSGSMGKKSLSLAIDGLKVKNNNNEVVRNNVAVPSNPNATIEITENKTPSVTITPVAITGKAGEPLPEKTATVKLYNAIFGSSSEDATDWFNLPGGITAQFTKSGTDFHSGTVTFSGTPQATVGQTNLTLTVPSYLVCDPDMGVPLMKEVTTTPNDDTYFKIDKAATAQGGATVENITITGKVGEALTNQHFSVNLSNDEVLKYLQLGELASVLKSMIKNLPAGLDVGVYNSVSSGDKKIDFLIKGTPTEASNADIQITIPGSFLKSGKDTVVTANNAKWDIKGSEASRVGATLSNITIQGEVGKEMAEVSATVTLENGTFCAAQNPYANSWFDNLPSGIKAVFVRTGDETSNTGTVTFSGTPEAAFTGPLQMKIKAENINDETGNGINYDVTATTNVDAKIEITESVVPSATISNFSITGKVGEKLTDQYFNVTLSNDEVVSNFKASELNLLLKSMIKNLPAGLEVGTHGSAAAGDKRILFGIKGTPTEASQADIQITIPGSFLKSGKDIVVTANNAKWDIKGSEASRVGATLGNITLQGEVGKEMTEVSVTVTLENGTFCAAQDPYASSWFDNLPSGIKAAFVRTGDETSNTGTVTFSGTPEAAFTGPLQMKIKAENINDENGNGINYDVIATTNADAKIEITQAIVPSATISNVAITGKVGNALAASTLTITLSDAVFVNATQDATSWFNLPAGITATFNRDGSDTSKGTVTFSGTPMAAASKTLLTIAIPIAQTVAPDGSPLSEVVRIATNVNAYFQIADRGVLVSGITGVPASSTAGVDLDLSASVSVEPSNASENTIVWSITDAGTTGATLDGSILKTKAAGTVRLTATIIGGGATGDYTQSFVITVNAAQPGTISTNSVLGNNVPNVTIASDMSALMESVLTNEEKARIAAGENGKIYLDVNDAGSSISSADKAAIGAKLGKDKVGMYLNMSLYKQIGEDGAQRIITTNSPIMVSIAIPSNLINKDATKVRTYRVISVLDGVTSVREGSYDASTGIFTFKADQFTTYALTYSDVAVKNSETPKSPKTGDTSNGEFALVLLALSGVVMIYLGRKRKLFLK